MTTINQITEQLKTVSAITITVNQWEKVLEEIAELKAVHSRYEWLREKIEALDLTLADEDAWGLFSVGGDDLDDFLCREMERESSQIEVGNE